MKKMEIGSLVWRNRFEMLAELQKKYANGWRLVSMVHDGENFVAFIEREKQ